MIIYNLGFLFCFIMFSTCSGEQQNYGRIYMSRTKSQPVSISGINSTRKHATNVDGLYNEKNETVPQENPEEIINNNIDSEIEAAKTLLENEEGVVLPMDSLERNNGEIDSNEILKSYSNESPIKVNPVIDEVEVNPSKSNAKEQNPNNTTAQQDVTLMHRIIWNGSVMSIVTFILLLSYYFQKQMNENRISNASESGNTEDIELSLGSIPEFDNSRHVKF